MIRLIVPGLSFCLVTDGSMRNPPRTPMNPGPCTITWPMVVRRATRYGTVSRRANRPPRPGGGASLPGGAAPAAQGHAGLGEDAVDEPVGPAGRGGQGADGLARVVAVLEVGRQLAAVFPGYPGAFSQRRRFGHLYLP